MALQFARGTVQWLAADAATTLYTISGLAFQPKVIRASCNGIKATVDTASTTIHERASIGFATGTASRRCVAVQDQDNAAAAICTSGAFNDCILATLTSTPARDGALDLDSIQSDGFKFIVDDAAPVDITVFWEAWGGTDIDDAGVGDIAEPAATGNQDYATGGKVASAVFLAGVQSTAAVNTAQRNDSGLMQGYTAGASDNMVVVGNNDDGSATMDSDRYTSLGTECLAMITTGGGNPDAKGSCTQLVASTGMRINWALRAVTNRRYIYCWIRGGQWRCVTASVNVNTAGNTATVSGLAFTPIGIVTNIGSGSGGANVQNTVNWGSASSTSDRACLMITVADATANCEVNLAVDYDALIARVNTSGVVSYNVDLDAILADGFRVIVDAADATLGLLRMDFLVFGSVTSLPIFDKPHFYRRKRLR